jgi:hypothetical protein
MKRLGSQSQGFFIVWQSKRHGDNLTRYCAVRIGAWAEVVRIHITLLFGAIDGKVTDAGCNPAAIRPTGFESLTPHKEVKDERRIRNF